MTTFLIDSNTIADFLSRQTETIHRISLAVAQGDTLGLCRPVHYEVLRGLLWRDALAKRHQFDRSIGLFFAWVELADEDWLQAARFYATTRRAGKQLADTDLLLAAIAHRLDATIISSDKDFDVLPVKRVTWRSS
jgi:predicted nucleic acid-binding protein